MKAGKLSKCNRVIPYARHRAKVSKESGSHLGKALHPWPFGMRSGYVVHGQEQDAAYVDDDGCRDTEKAPALQCHNAVFALLKRTFIHIGI